jgi:protoporphyrinogen oxidase
MAKVAVIGAGAMGLAAAHHALKAGHDVTVFEADSVPGGMAAHFDFGGLSIERFYHFCCKTDHATVELLAELGLPGAMKWRPTFMGYFIDGKHYRWGDPFALLAFPLLGIVDKFRYGLQVWLASKRKDWGPYDAVSTKEWIEGALGRKVYDLLWRPLFDLKFYEYADRISAAWTGVRIGRVGKSRKSIFQEELGYIEGGTETLVHALVRSIEAQGGVIHLATPVEEISSQNSRVTGVRARGAFHAFDSVISTMPTPHISRIVPGLSDATKARYDAIENIGVICVLLKLSKPVTRNFWLNVNDPRLPVPGIVEYSNLRPLPAAVVYVPYYMPVTNAKFATPDADIIKEAFAIVRTINPDITDTDLLDARAGRLKHAQPVYVPGFQALLPPVETEIAGLQIADTCFYYPEDRGISESVRFGKLMAGNLN